MSDIMQEDNGQVIFDDDLSVEFEDEEVVSQAGNGQANQAGSQDTVVLTKAELLAMQNGGSQIEKLAELLAKQQQPVNVPQQQIGETDEQFEARVHEELFTPGKTAKVLQEVVARATKPLVTQYEQTIAGLQQKIAFQQNDSIISKYSTEAQQMLSQLTPSQRANPEAIKWVEDQLKLKHMDDIIAEKVAAAVAGAKPANKPQAFQRGSQGSQEPRVVKVKKSEYDMLFQKGMQLYGTKEAAEKYVRTKLDN